MLNLILPKVGLKLKRDTSFQTNDEFVAESSPPRDVVRNRRKTESVSPLMKKKPISTRRKQNHSRTSSITFPDGAVPEEYGLPPIDKSSDVDHLQRFEVIRYLEAFNIFPNNHLGEEELRTMLKETIYCKRSKEEST